jgi:hypothetical protein
MVIMSYCGVSEPKCLQSPGDIETRGLIESKMDVSV